MKNNHIDNRLASPIPGAFPRCRDFASPYFYLLVQMQLTDSTDVTAWMYFEISRLAMTSTGNSCHSCPQ